MKTRKEYTCPLEITHDITKGKWKTIILWQLKNKGCSLSELKSGIKSISQKTLIEQLNEMLEYKLVRKRSLTCVYL
jgi:DNA-binding HxlR family transcriptional regulator